MQDITLILDGSEVDERYEFPYDVLPLTKITRTRTLLVNAALAAVLVVAPGPAGLSAQTDQPKTEPLRLGSDSTPELLAAIELNKAVRKGDVEQAGRILALVPSLWAETPIRQTMLNLAGQEGHPSMVEWLLQRGANPSEAVGQITPLAAALGWTHDILLERQEKYPETWKQLEQHLQASGTAAARAVPPPNSTKPQSANLEGIRRMFEPMPPELLARKTQVVELLLSAGAKPTNPSVAGAGPSPLFYAAQMGFGADVINRLIQAGADPRAALTTTNETPLHVAAMNGNLGAVEALLAQKAGLESLSTASLSGRPGMQIGSGGTTPLMNAITLSQEDMVRFLLGKGAKLETTNHTLDRALHFAAMTGHPGILGQLLDRGARVNTSDRWQSTPLHYGALNGHLEAVKILLNAKADLEALDEAGFTPLLNAVEHDHLDMVVFLLSQGASRLSRTDAGKGPLRVAATANALQVAKFLLDHGEKVDGEPADTMRPLHEAASSGHPKMVALLLQHGASTEVRDRAWACTPLIMAVRSRPESAKQWVQTGPPKASYAMSNAEAMAYLEIIRLLAAQGADLNATDRGRNTALHYATEYGDRESVELLLTLGARRDFVNGRDMTPHDIATLKGHREIAALVQAAATSKH